MKRSLLLLVALCGGALGASVPVRRWSPSADPDAFDTEADNVYVNESAALTANTTALVIVDLWEDELSDPLLAENIAKRMLPLLALARATGMLVVHAPSQGARLANVSVLPGELLVTGEDGTPGSASRCDAAIARAGASRPAGPVRTVLLAGYDSNYCMVDKPCGAATLAPALAALSPLPAELLLVRDAARPQPRWYGNAWYSTALSSNMLEAAPWQPGRPIRSTTVGELAAALAAAEAPLPLPPLPLPPLLLPAPSAAQTFRAPALPPSMRAADGVALVLVSCSQDYANDGFRARVVDLARRQLAALLAAARAHPGQVTVIHVPNGHALPVSGGGGPAPVDPALAAACTAQPGEPVVASQEEFAATLAARGIKTLLYAGVGANTDVLWGHGGMAYWYSRARYLRQPAPRYYWVGDAVVALEMAGSQEGEWALRTALAYRQPLPGGAAGTGNILAAADVARQLCADAPPPAPPAPGAVGNATVVFEMDAPRAFASAADAVVDADIGGPGHPAPCGGPSMLGWPNVTIDIYASSAKLAAGADRKLLCFRKSVGTPLAVYQLKLSDDKGTLQYQAADAAGVWRTLSAPGFFALDNVEVRATVVHAGTDVRIFRNGVLVARSSNSSSSGSSSSSSSPPVEGVFAPLSYTNAEAMVVGWRKGDEFWQGEISSVVVTAGVVLPPSSGTFAPLPAAERGALADIFDASNGSAVWQYKRGTDAVGGGARWMVGDPCQSGWFGVKCGLAGPNETVPHVLQLFPNTRGSGNPLGGQLPDSVGALTHLEHLYTSNDKSNSALSGTIPDAMGALTKLKCMYFSHNRLEGSIPAALERLTDLQVFLMRCNKLEGTLPDFSRLPRLRNVWFDSQDSAAKLTGSLASLGALQNLTFLQASNNAFEGALPPSLCDINCDAAGNANLSCPLPAPGCCQVSACGPTPAPVKPPPSSMGECFPQ